MNKQVYIVEFIKDGIIYYHPGPYVKNNLISINTFEDNNAKKFTKNISDAYLQDVIQAFETANVYAKPYMSKKKGSWNRIADLMYFDEIRIRNITLNQFDPDDSK